MTVNLNSEMYHSTYTINGTTEQILQAGDGNDARCILFVPPLFDEMNRMRRVMVSAMRALAKAGIRSALLDLPGCNESAADLAAQDLDIWCEAVVAAASQLNATHVASIRGGALIDNGIADLPHWRLSPVGGSSLIKTMLRARIASDKESGVTSTTDGLLELGRTAPIELAGNRIGCAMLASLQQTEIKQPSNVTAAMLGDGDDNVTGSALWLRAEPQDDPAMAASIAMQLDRWSAVCAR